MIFDIIIHNGIIVTVDSHFNIIQNGVMGIKDGKLLRIETKTPDCPLPDGKEVIDAKGGIIMPGLVNTHTHLPMTLFRGLADDLPLWEWLNHHIFPAEAKYINSESVRYGTLLACAEMILSGTTTCCDGYFYEDDVAKAVCDSGMRAVCGQGVIDFPAPGVQNPSENITHALSFIEKWQDVSPLILPSIFCHSPLTCSPETLKKSKQAANAKGILFQIHAAETKDEWNRIRAEYGVSPIAYLDQLGVLDENTLLVHCIWVDNQDVKIIAQRKASVSVTTESEMKLSSGISPIPKFLTELIPVGLGTDGAASNNDLDIFSEMDITAKIHKVNTHNPTVMNAQTVLTLATRGGAKAICLDKHIGSLEIGKQADVIIIDTHKPHLVPIYNPISLIVYAASGADVRDVIVAGKILLRNRKLLTIDIDEVLGV